MKFFPSITSLRIGKLWHINIFIKPLMWVSANLYPCINMPLLCRPAALPSHEQEREEKSDGFFVQGIQGLERALSSQWRSSICILPSWRCSDGWHVPGKDSACLHQSKRWRGDEHRRRTIGEKWQHFCWYALHEVDLTLCMLAGKPVHVVQQLNRSQELQVLL